MTEAQLPADKRTAADALGAACRAAVARTRALEQWSVDDAPQGLIVCFQIAGEAIEIAVGRRGSTPCYAQTPSLNLTIQVREPIVRLSPLVERVLILWVSLLRAVDDGGLALPASTSLQSEQMSARDSWRDTGEARRAHERLADELHFAAFVARKAVVTEDLYPHISPLGQRVSHDEIREGWVRTTRAIQAGQAPPKLGLYIHIPFCGVACSFCFCGKTDQFNRVVFDAYVAHLLAEIEAWRPVFRGHRFTSVYFGGGTPSLLSPLALEQLFAVLYAAFDVPEGTQVIFEGNPDSLSERKIEILAKQGRVTRLTIGVQTLDAEAQRSARRFNKPEQVADAVKAARRYGIPLVNVDLMAGLDGQSFEAFQHDVRFVLGLQPDALHLNGFRPLPHTSFAKTGNSISAAQIELRDQMLDWGLSLLEGTLPEQREVLGRTKNAANIQEFDLRRQNSSLLGLGFPARSHSFGGHYYLPDMSGGFDTALRNTIDGNGGYVAVRVDPTEEAHKFLVDNLRTGFERREFRALFGCEPEEVAVVGWQKLRELGVVRSDADRVFCSPGAGHEPQVYGWFWYSDAVKQRVREVWGAEYARDADYVQELRALVEAPQRGLGSAPSDLGRKRLPLV